jgi:hypothetical protein
MVQPQKKSAIKEAFNSDKFTIIIGDKAIEYYISDVQSFFNELQKIPWSASHIVHEMEWFLNEYYPNNSTGKKYKQFTRVIKAMQDFFFYCVVSTDKDFNEILSNPLLNKCGTLLTLELSKCRAFCYVSVLTQLFVDLKDVSLGNFLGTRWIIEDLKEFILTHYPDDDEVEELKSFSILLDALSALFLRLDIEYKINSSKMNRLALGV